MSGLRELLWYLETSVGPSAIPDDPVIVMGGQSNNADAGGNASATYGGAAVDAAITAHVAGSTIANWAAAPGFAPDLCHAILDAGASSVRLVMRAVTGSALQATHTTHFDAAVRDLAGLGWPAPTWFHFWQGEQEASSGAGSEALADGWGEQFRRLSFRARKAWPNVRIINMELWTTAAAQYPWHTNVRAAQQALPATIGNMASIDTSGLDGVGDTVHVDPDTGYPVAASRVAAELLVA